jgi:hypothetical protein
MPAAFWGLLAMLTASCGKLDVVGTDSIASFDKILRQTPQAVRPDEMNGGWSLAAPDGAVRFIRKSGLIPDFCRRCVISAAAELRGIKPDFRIKNQRGLSQNFSFWYTGRGRRR